MCTWPTHIVVDNDYMLLLSSDALGLLILLWTMFICCCCLQMHLAYSYCCGQLLYVAVVFRCTWPTNIVVDNDYMLLLSSDALGLLILLWTMFICCCCLQMHLAYSYCCGQCLYVAVVFRCTWTTHIVVDNVYMLLLSSDALGLLILLWTMFICCCCLQMHLAYSYCCGQCLYVAVVFGCTWPTHIAVDNVYMLLLFSDALGLLILLWTMFICCCCFQMHLAYSYCCGQCLYVAVVFRCTWPTHIVVDNVYMLLLFSDALGLLILLWTMFICCCCFQMHLAYSSIDSSIYGITITPFLKEYHISEVSIHTCI